jgi:hypothetical protein
MRFASNPLIEEAVMHRLFARPVVILFAAHLLLLTAVTLLAWPGPSPTEILLLGVTPRAYGTVLILAFVSLAFINVFLDTPALRGSGGFRDGQWLRLSPVSLPSFFGGKLAAMLMQTGILTAATLPLLTAAAAVSGAGIVHVLAAGGAILLFTLAYRIMGFSVALALESHPLVLAILDAALLLILLFGTAALAPSSNPIVVLSGIDSPDTLLFQNLPRAGPPASRALGSCVLHGVPAAVFLAAAVLYGRHARKAQKVYSGEEREGKAGKTGAVETHRRSNGRPGTALQEDT